MRGPGPVAEADTAGPYVNGNKARAKLGEVRADKDLHDRERGIRVAVNSVDGWFEDNLANHATTARAIEEGDVESAAMPWSRSPVSDRSRLSRRKGGAGRRNGRAGGSRSLRTK